MNESEQPNGTPHRGTTTLYQLAWILPGIAIPVGMLLALAMMAFAAAIHVHHVRLGVW